MSETVYKSYPNLYYNVQPEPWHLDIAQDLLANHRRVRASVHTQHTCSTCCNMQDMGISAEARFEPTYFVVRGSNAAAGGGANEVSYQPLNDSYPAW